jgi:hypothetical protein
MITVKGRIATMNVIIPSTKLVATFIPASIASTIR